MLEYFTLILVCQLIGEFTVTKLGAPFPGPVVGMVLLFVFLLLKGEVPEQLGNVSNALLNNLSLLFVPAGVGVMVHVNLLGTDLWPLSIAMVASTLLTVVVTALVMAFLNKYTAKSQKVEGEV
jgi:holin-like protein